MSIRPVVLVAFLAIVAGCSPVMRVHGYVPSQSDIDLLLVGSDTKLSVEESGGRPSDKGFLDGNSWYYVESTVRNFMFLEPSVSERRVMVFDFDANDVLTSIENFGLEDGRVINLETRVTPTDSRRTGILAALFGNVGAIAPPIPGR